MYSETLFDYSTNCHTTVTMFAHPTPKDRFWLLRSHTTMFAHTPPPLSSTFACFILVSSVSTISTLPSPRLLMNVWNRLLIIFRPLNDNEIRDLFIFSDQSLESFFGF